MKLSVQSHNSIVSAIQKALERYSGKEGMSVVTDIHLLPSFETGELKILNDDDEELACIVVNEWVEAMPEGFYASVEVALKKVLNQLRETGYLNALNILKPYSFVLLDGTKETVAELLLVDDEETLFLNDELLKGLDEELNAFLKDLLEK
ncbi:MAG: hypothetical protein J6B31_04695 [Bacteroidaceae bacterium]|nr:hypothetical protein [Bacteroidaceae bacterium]MBQ8889995.1 hypothetical protein [Bacteroidaceae bacterium]